MSNEIDWIDESDHEDYFPGVIQPTRYDFDPEVKVDESKPVLLPYQKPAPVEQKQLKKG